MEDIDVNNYIKVNMAPDIVVKSEIEIKEEPLEEVLEEPQEEPLKYF